MARRSGEPLIERQLDRDPALVLLAKIVNGADTDNTLWHQPESAGLRAIAEGFRHLGFKNDHEVNAAESIPQLREIIAEFFAAAAIA